MTSLKESDYSRNDYTYTKIIDLSNNVIIKRVSNIIDETVFIPPDMDNSDYVSYLKWSSTNIPIIQKQEIPVIDNSNTPITQSQFDDFKKEIYALINKTPPIIAVNPLTL